MATSFWNHPIETIEKALHIRKQIQALEEHLNEMLGGDPALPLPFQLVKDGRKGKRSAATRAKMVAAAKARWAKKSAAPVKTPKTKRVVTGESRAKMVASQRARRTKEKIAPGLSLPNKLIW